MNSHANLFVNTILLQPRKLVYGIDLIIWNTQLRLNESLYTFYLHRKSKRQVETFGLLIKESLGHITTCHPL